MGARWENEIRPFIMLQPMDEREQARDPAWMSRYNDYLGSPEWEARRQKIFLRSGGVCECCHEAPATQVHHLTYARVGREALFDLRAVCPPCHEALHGTSNAYPVNPLMVTAAEWLHGANTWIAHIRQHLKSIDGEAFIPDALANRIGGAFDRLEKAEPVETSEGRAAARALWFDIWAACQELTRGQVKVIEGFYLPKEPQKKPVENPNQRLISRFIADKPVSS
jgi:hypothetical protein